MILNSAPQLIVETVILSVGSHPTRQDGLCAMEMVAWLAGDLHSDHPRCTSPILAAYVRHLNDHMPDGIRQELMPFLPRLIDTTAPEPVEQMRSEFLAWKAVRVFAPAALRAGRRSKRREHFACVLERQSEFFSAVNRTMRIRKALEGRGYSAEDWSPVAFAVHRAHEAIRSAFSFSINQDNIERVVFSGTAYDACALAAAGAVFQAHRANSENIWSLALDALEEVLAL